MEIVMFFRFAPTIYSHLDNIWARIDNIWANSDNKNLHNIFFPKIHPIWKKMLREIILSELKKYCRANNQNMFFFFQHLAKQILSGRAKLLSGRKKYCLINILANFSWSETNLVGAKKILSECYIFTWN